VYGTDQTGTVEALPGNSFFTTATIAGANTVKIFWQDEANKRRSRTKASSGAQCDQGAAARTAETGTKFQEEVQQEVQLFPNPAQHALHLRLPAPADPVTVTLTDMMGRQVLKYHQADGQLIDLPVQQYTKGLYQVTVEQAGQRIFRKLLIE
jgi:beta-galactosidase GanA